MHLACSSTMTTNSAGSRRQSLRRTIGAHPRRLLSRMDTSPARCSVAVQACAIIHPASGLNTTAPKKRIRSINASRCRERPRSAESKSTACGFWCGRAVDERRVWWITRGHVVDTLLTRKIKLASRPGTPLRTPRRRSTNSLSLSTGPASKATSTGSQKVGQPTGSDRQANWISATVANARPSDRFGERVPAVQRDRARPLHLIHGGASTHVWLMTRKYFAAAIARRSA